MHRVVDRRHSTVFWLADDRFAFVAGLFSTAFAPSTAGYQGAAPMRPDLGYSGRPSRLQ